MSEPARHGWTGTPAIRVALHLPDAASANRVGVVVCPPLGQDAVVAYRTLRHLADELAAHGIAAVRFDPAGQGDSAPDADADAPVRSAVTAADVLRATGRTTIVFVGLASGALVAAAAARQVPGAGLVAWDAPASGRAWLRRQRALAALTIGADRVLDGRESIIGLDLTPGATAALGALTTTADGSGPVLVLTRPGAPAPAGIVGDHVTHREVEGTAELLDGTSMRARIPGRAVTTISDWVRLTVPSGADAWAPEPVVDPDRLLDDHLVVRHPDGDVRERIVVLGPNRLFGIETVPVHAATGLPTVVLHNGAAEHRVGAADYQVTLARTLARDGVRVVRFDRRGTGESSAVHPDETSYLFSQEWVEDQADVVAALGVGGDELAIAGMCSGAWLAARAGAIAPRLVIEISPNDYRRRPAAPGEFSEAARVVEDIGAARQWARDRWNRWVPAAVRLRLARVGETGDVAAHLRPVVRAGGRSVLVMGPLDAAMFERAGGPAAAAGFGDRVEVVRVPDGDHSLFAPRMRAEVIEVVRDRVRTTFGLATGPTDARTPATTGMLDV